MMSTCVAKVSENKTKLILSVKTSETSASITSIIINIYHIFDRNTIHIIILNFSPIDVFLKGFWRSMPSMNTFVLNCISCNKKRRAKTTPKNRVQYISISPSPQLTSSSSSSSTSGVTTTSSVSSESSRHSVKTSPKSMAPNDSSSSSAPVASAPSAPTPGLVLFNSEEQADIVFLVGRDNEQIWRFPAHSFIVENASLVFRDIVERETTNEKPINKRIKIKAELFHTILRHIYTNEITITSVANALDLFTAANQFLLNELSKICLTFLYNNCSEDNVLEMLSHFSQFSYLRPSFLTPVDINGSPLSLSAIMSKQSSLQFANNVDNILNELITRCYYTLDSASSRILASDAFSNLEHDLIVKILSRDTLNIVSEIEVFECIKRWACHQCKRQCRELTGDNKRQVLGKALYCPRYLTMTFDEFMRGPQMSDLLSDQEKQPLLARLAGDSQVPSLPDQLLGRKQDVKRRFVEQIAKPIVDESVANTTNSNAGNGSNAGIVVKKKSTSKKLLNGLGDLVICVIRLLD